MTFLSFYSKFFINFVNSKRLEKILHKVYKAFSSEFSHISLTLSQMNY